MMIDEDTGLKPDTPWHLWLVGILAVLWNAMGAFDYVMTQTRNEAYLASFTEEQLAFFTSFPTWMVFAWATAIWTSVIGSVLLLFKSKFSVPVFGISIVSMLISYFHNYVLENGAELMGAGGLLFTGVIIIVAFALFFYARGMAKRGVLA